MPRYAGFYHIPHMSALCTLPRNPGKKSVCHWVRGRSLKTTMLSVSRHSTDSIPFSWKKCVVYVVVKSKLWEHSVRQTCTVNAIARGGGAGEPRRLGLCPKPGGGFAARMLLRTPPPDPHCGPGMVLRQNPQLHSDIWAQTWRNLMTLESNTI